MQIDSSRVRTDFISLEDDRYTNHYFFFTKIALALNIPRRLNKEAESKQKKKKNEKLIFFKTKDNRILVFLVEYHWKRTLLGMIYYQMLQFWKQI